MALPDIKRYGKPWAQIEGSACYRGYCLGCNAPVRLDLAHANDKRSIYCEDCSPKHIGCSSPPSPIDEIDEYSSSWKIATEEVEND